MVEQRYRAVLEVLGVTPVTEVAERFGVARQTVHRWVARYRESGIDRFTFLLGGSDGEELFGHDD